MSTEAWLRGPVPDIIAELVPAAHILIQAGEELSEAVTGLTPGELWAKSGGAARIGFHLSHIAGSTDRLLSYAAASALTAEQKATLAAEQEVKPDTSTDQLLSAALSAIQRSLATLRNTTREGLFEPRTVGRARLPTDVIGLLYHIAAHTMRHTGQVIATAKALRGLGLGSRIADRGNG